LTVRGLPDASSQTPLRIRAQFFTHERVERYKIDHLLAIVGAQLNVFCHILKVLDRHVARPLQRQLPNT